MNEITPLEVGFWAKYGPLGMALLVFAGVIAYLFRLLYTTQAGRVARAEAALEEAKKTHAQERERWVTEKANALASFEIERKTFELEAQKMRSDFDQRLREASQQHARDLHELRREYQGREDDGRRENAESLERMASAHVTAMEKVSLVLQKFYDRYVGARSRQR